MSALAVLLAVAWVGSLLGITYIARNIPNSGIRPPSELIVGCDRIIASGGGLLFEHVRAEPHAPAPPAEWEAKLIRGQRASGFQALRWLRKVGIDGYRNVLYAPGGTAWRTVSTT